ncbi:hypothetical protein GF068_40650 [Polyangium spumosum]|uniref:Uncharacterized protein n=1 Tax=Polyangium spumosum TaxID=889282 RepID=A0A6N7Q2B9_9BACT|nr:hypothetical protein [Polyangium spumosum]
MTVNELAALHGDLVEHLRFCSTVKHRAAAAFCLFAAESISRSDGTQWWAWDSAVMNLGRQLEQSDIRDAVQEGLRFWKRQLWRGDARREFLGTLVSEGGLPLALLKDDDGRLRPFFRELLRRHEMFPDTDLVKEAEELSAGLPRRMQYSVVFDLAAKLVRAVAQMRRNCETTSDSTNVDLPLRLDDEPARALLEGLRAEPQISVRAERGIVVKTILHQRTDLLIGRRIDLPPRLSRTWIASTIGLNETEELPPRLYFSVQVASGSRSQVAVGTLADDSYVLRSTHTRDIVRSAIATEQVSCIISTTEGDLGSFIPRGGEALPDGPWVFEDEASECALRATTSCRLRAASLLVAVPTEGTSECAGLLDNVGSLLNHGREVVRIFGAFIWRDGEDEVVVTPQAEADDAFHFELRGSRPALVLDPDLWRGRPEIVEIRSPIVARVPAAELRWRRRGARWSADMRQALGDGEIGVARGGVIVFRARVHVLPDDLQIAIRSGTLNSGSVTIESKALIDVGVEPLDGVTTVTRADAKGFSIVVSVETSVPPSTLQLVLRMEGGSRTELTMPFPIKNASFIGRNGRFLADGAAAVSLDELAHVRAVVTGGKAGIWSIDVRHKTGTSRLVGLRETAKGSGVLSCHLEPLRDALAAILAEDSKLDHEVTLKLVEEGRSVQGAVSLFVRRYDASPEPRTEADGSHSVVLEPGAAQLLGPEIVALLRAEAVQLDRLDEPAIPLPQIGPGQWSVTAANLHAGAWLVLLYQRDYLRARPLRITVPGAAEDVPTGTMAAALREADEERRRDMLARAVVALPDDGTGVDWDAARPFIAKLGVFPASTFDLLGAVSRCPRVAVLSLLESANRDRVWYGLEELPFLWAATPVADWLHAIGAYKEALRSQLPSDISIEMILRESAPDLFGSSKRTMFLDVIHDAAYLVHKHIPKPGERWVFNATNPSFAASRVPVFSHYLQELARRHAENDWWPTSTPWEDMTSLPVLAPFVNEIRGLGRFKQNVLMTPLVLAGKTAAGDARCDLLRLRQVRDFDPEWFDFAYAIALAVVLGNRRARKEAPFHD